MAFAAALYGPHLVRGQLLPARDVGATQVPWRTILGAQLRQGELPLWDPLSNQGRLLLANPSCQAAYPPTLLAAVVPAGVALGVLQALHHLLFLLGCFWLARKVVRDDGAAVVAAAATGTTGLAFSVLLHVNIQASLAWAPWAVALALPDRSEPEHRLGRALAAGGLVGLAFLAGEPITALLAAVTVAAVVLLTWQHRRLAALGVAGVAAAAVALPVLLPLLVSYPDTVRGALGVAPGALAADALAPRRWPELLLPRLLGNTLATAPTGFWAAPSFPWLCYFPSVFVGPFVPLLLGFALLSRHRLRPWWILLAVGTAGAVVTGIPSAAAALEHVPGAHNVRFGIKLLLLSILVLPPLLAAGWQELAARWRRAGRRAVAAVLAGAALALPAALLPDALLRPVLARAYPASRDSLASVPSAALRRNMLLDLAAVAAPAAVLIVGGPVPLAAAAAVLAGNTVAAGNVLLFEDARWWAREPAVRVVLDGTSPIASFAERAAPDTAPRHPALESYWRSRAALVANYGSRWGTGYVLERGPDALEPVRGYLLAAAADDLPLADRGRVAAALGARAVIADEPVPGRAAVQVDGVWVSRLDDGSPPCYLADRALPAEGPVAAAATMSSQGFRPGRDVVVDGSGGARPLAGGRVVEQPGAPSRRRFTTVSAGAGILVVQQSYMAAWRAFVDGDEIRPVPANGAVLGIPVPAGEHDVELAVDRRPYLLGMLGPLLLIGGVLSLRVRSSRGRAAPTDGPERTVPPTATGR